MRALAHRLLALEGRLERQFTARWESMTPQEQRALCDECALILIRQGILPAPDPTPPEASIDELRRTAPDALTAWHQASLGNPDWCQRHPAVIYEDARLPRPATRPCRRHAHGPTPSPGPARTQ